MRITIDFAEITDWASFHASFCSVMGFPEFYGGNMNAWIDCMSYIDDSSAGMSKIAIEPGDSLIIEVRNSQNAKRKIPHIFNGFLECVQMVNDRFEDDNIETRLILEET